MILAMGLADKGAYIGDGQVVGADLANARVFKSGDGRTFSCHQLLMGLSCSRILVEYLRAGYTLESIGRNCIEITFPDAQLTSDGDNGPPDSLRLFVGFRWIEPAETLH